MRIKVGNSVALNQGGEVLSLVIYEVSLLLKFFIKRFDRLFSTSHFHFVSACDIAIDDGIHDVVGIFLIVAAGFDFNEICAPPRFRRNHRFYFLEGFFQRETPALIESNCLDGGVERLSGDDCFKFTFHVVPRHQRSVRGRVCRWSNRKHRRVNLKHGGGFIFETHQSA